MRGAMVVEAGERHVHRARRPQDQASHASATYTMKVDSTVGTSGPLKDVQTRDKVCEPKGILKRAWLNRGVVSERAVRSPQPQTPQ